MTSSPPALIRRASTSTLLALALAKGLATVLVTTLLCVLPAPADGERS
jgi:hypothetical protein